MSMYPGMMSRICLRRIVFDMGGGKYCVDCAFMSSCDALADDRICDDFVDLDIDNNTKNHGRRKDSGGNDCAE